MPDKKPKKYTVEKTVVGYKISDKVNSLIASGHIFDKDDVFHENQINGGMTQIEEWMKIGTVVEVVKEKRVELKEEEVVPPVKDETPPPKDKKPPAQ